MANLRIQYMNPEDLKEYDKNPRINEQAVEKVAESIQEFGFNNPIIIDQDKIIIAGHTRLKAARQLGLEKVPVIQLQDLTPEQIKAFRIADNKTSEFAQWDFDLLLEELKDLEAAGYDLELTGFSEDEIADMEHEDEVILDEDDFDIDEQLQKPTFTKTGDVWILGRHRLVVGDSTKKSDVATLMNGKEADLIITDPPYNVDYQGSTGMKIENDHMSDGNFYAFLLEAYSRMFESARPGAPIYVFHADSEGYNFRGAFKAAGFKLAQCLVWVKNSLVLGRQDYHWIHEPILYGWKEGAAHSWYGARNKATVLEEDKLDLKKMKKDELLDLLKEILKDTEHTTVIREDKPTKNDIHPTMKPIRLIGRLLQNSSRKHDTILDLFGGSGSTMIAAEQLNRTAYIMEIDPKYADAIVNRYLELTDEESQIAVKRDGKMRTYREVQV